jgi:CRP/FNR family transcriptional regulator, cyclic AMP receptor protein
MRSDFLRTVPLFATLSDAELESVAPAFNLKTYLRNQVVFLEEETGSYMYIVLAGKVKVTKSTQDGRESILAIHRAGDFFGEMSLLDGKTSPATVTAMEDSRIASIGRVDFHYHLLRNNKILLQIIQVLCSRLRHVWSQVQILSYGSAEARIRGAILNLSRRHGVTHDRGIVIDLKITHHEIAEMAGTSRETVSRLLSRLRKEQVIAFDRRRIVILSTQLLRGYS